MSDLKTENIQSKIDSLSSKINSLLAEEEGLNGLAIKSIEFESQQASLAAKCEWVCESKDDGHGGTTWWCGLKCEF